MLADALNFILIITLFFVLPNNIVKTNIFLFNALVVKPLVSIFAIMGLMTLSKKFAKFTWVLFALALVVVLFLYLQAFQKFQSLPMEFAYVHPAYPALVTQNEASGAIGGLLFAGFFLYHAFHRTLFIRRRALVLALSMLLLGISSLYWVSEGPALYISMHIMGPLGSLLFAAGVFLFNTKKAVYAKENMQL